MKPTPSRSRFRYPVPILVAGAMLGITDAHAAEWEHALTPYLWMAGMGGGTTVATPLGPVEGDIDMSFSEILKDLRIGGMAAYEGRYGNWVVLSDVVYMDLQGSEDFTGPVQRVRLGTSQLGWELQGGYFITSRIALYAGARYNDIDADVRVDLATGTRRSAGGGASWVDPLVGLVGHFPYTERLSVDLKGDIGGFGVGSEFTWVVTAGVRWKLNDAWDLTASYRYMDIDYEDEGGNGLVRYDVVSHGPMLGATWHF